MRLNNGNVPDKAPEAGNSPAAAYPRFRNKLVIALLLLGLAVTVTLSSHFAQAQAVKQGDLQIGAPWARATVAGAKAGAGFFRITNKGTKPDRLLSASAQVSDVVELHEMTMDAGMMKMRKIEALEIPVGKSVDLKPGSFHIMFINLKAPLEKGASFPLKLTFQQAGEVTVNVKVEAVNFGGNEHAHH